MDRVEGVVEHWAVSSVVVLLVGVESLRSGRNEGGLSVRYSVEIERLRWVGGETQSFMVAVGTGAARRRRKIRRSEVLNDDPETTSWSVAVRDRRSYWSVASGRGGPCNGPRSKNGRRLADVAFDNRFYGSHLVTVVVLSYPPGGGPASVTVTVARVVRAGRVRVTVDGVQ